MDTAPLVPEYIRLAAIRNILMREFPDYSYDHAESLAKDLLDLAHARMTTEGV